MDGFLVGADEGEPRARAERLAECQGAPVDLDELARTWIVGTPERVIAHLGEYADAGIGRVMLQHHLFRDDEALELMAADVAPALASRPGVRQQATVGLSAPPPSVIDLHCHLLPGIDDGPRTMDETIAMARVAAADGSRTVVATPHVSWTYPGNTAAVIAAKLDEVRAALAQAQIALDVRIGAEVEVTRAVRLDDAELEALRLGGGPWLLVECPIEAYSSAAVARAMRSLTARGHRVVLAHPERSRAFQRDLGTLTGLIADGMVTCITAAALSGRFGKTSRSFAKALVDDRLAHVVASDGHDATRRSPRLRSELDAAGIGAEAVLLAGAAPAAILSGAQLPRGE